MATQTSTHEESIHMPTVPIYTDDESRSAVTSCKRIYLMRNGEPCDRLFPGWRLRAFPDHDTYLQMGSLSAQLIGRAFGQRHLPIHSVFSSPSLRCVETAKALLSALSQKRKPRICIEPGLFEPLHFHWQDKRPNFVAPDDLLRHEFPVEAEYTPVYTAEKMNDMLFGEKTVDDMYSRVSRVAKLIVDAAQERTGGGGVLVVSHAPTIDALTRGIVGMKHKPKTWEDVHGLGLSYPYCSVTTLELSPNGSTDAKWLRNPEALPPLTYMHMSTVACAQSFRG
ncbi:ubiquitin associated and SH3 domain-containing protein B [Aphelenchoides avenae]|nr:ubiquitin associated and SH3 domain-containing protein B [Aphelenchus avenae]